jgi:hypothetical protein
MVDRGPEKLLFSSVQLLDIIDKVLYMLSQTHFTIL